MRRLIILIGVSLSVTAAPALAGTSGGGLYKPFPPSASQPAAQHPGRTLAQEYYAKRGTNLTSKQLHDGRFAAGLAASGDSAASSRAGSHAGGVGIWALLISGALVLAGGGIAAAARRRGAPRAAAG